VTTHVGTCYSGAGVSAVTGRLAGTMRTMSLLRLLAVGTLLGLLTDPIAAHPGHGEKKMLSGTIVAIEPTKVQMEVFDQASFSTQRLWVVVDDTTTVRSGKNRLVIADLRTGQSVECAAETDEGPDGASLLLAITLRVKPSK
jgi:hypothetical protein